MTCVGYPLRCLFNNQTSDFIHQAQEHKLLVSNEVKTVEKRVNGVDKKFVENDMKRMCNDVKEVKAEVKGHSKGVNYAKTAVTEFEERVLELKEECIDGRGRQKNVLFHGVKEEDREDCILLAKRIIREECKVNEPVIIERAHRVGKSRRGMIGKKAAEPRPLIVKFNSYADRQLVKKCARNYLPDYLSCREDLPYAVREARKKLAGQFDAAKRDPNVNKVYIAYPARLIVDGQLITAINPATCEPIETLGTAAPTPPYKQRLWE